jgi:hypothetical protein
VAERVQRERQLAGWREDGFGRMASEGLLLRLVAAALGVGEAALRSLSGLDGGRAELRSRGAASHGGRQGRHGGWRGRGRVWYGMVGGRVLQPSEDHSRGLVRSRCSVHTQSPVKLNAPGA